MQSLQSGSSTRAYPVLFATVLFFLALTARGQHLQQYVTTDEDLTLARSGSFAEALADGRWPRTYQIGHPEVTVMWVTTLVLTPEWVQEFAATARPEGGVAERRGASDVATFTAALGRARLGLAVVHSALIVLAALLLWRLAGAWAGLLGGALLALEPFLVAHGQLLRGDALVAELTLLAVLSATAYWRRSAGSWALLLSGVSFGLALLTKTPAILVLPVVLVLAWWSPRRRALALWMSAAIAVFVGLWPAMWLRPWETLDRVVEYTMLKGGSPMDAGSFLLGQASPDPGVLFYPAALLMRLSPVALAGLVALVWWRGGRTRSLVLVLLLAATVFALAITIAPKKADRYLILVIPLVLTLAGLGAAEAVRRSGRLGATLIPILGVAALGASLLAVRPYALAYYNPLVGGGAMASRLLLVGWGEGLDQVAAYLNAQEDAINRTVAVFYPDALDAQFVGNVVPLNAYDIADFAVLYIAADQRNLTPSALATALRDQAPDFEVAINGIRYARVYRLAPPEFDGGIALESIDLDDRTVGRGEPVGLTMRWRESSPAPTGWRTRVTLIRQDGQTAAESFGPWQPPSASEPPIREERHMFSAPRPLGRYTVAVSLQRDLDSALLPVVHRPPGLEPSPNQLVFQSLWLRVQ